jgi:hypothetical protein
MAKISHATHAHENTSKARAECRALIAKGEPIELKLEAKPAPARMTVPKKAATA